MYRKLVVSLFSLMIYICFKWIWLKNNLFAMFDDLNFDPYCLNFKAVLRLVISRIQGLNCDFFVIFVNNYSLVKCVNITKFYQKIVL